MEGFIKICFNFKDILWPLVDSHCLKSKCIVFSRFFLIREKPLGNPVIRSFLFQRDGWEMAMENRQIHST